MTFEYNFTMLSELNLFITTSFFINQSLKITISLRAFIKTIPQTMSTGVHRNRVK